jgi:hypothetical protein
MRLWFGDQLAVPALETMLPLRASAGSGVRGPLPSNQSGIRVSRPRAIVTVLKQGSKDKVTLCASGNSPENPVRSLHNFLPDHAHASPDP